MKNCGDLPRFDCHKVIIRRGSQEASVSNGCKVTFHFVTELCGEPDKDILDDSRNFTKPMEIVIGKQFKLPVWESCLASMREGEVAQFTAVVAYPLIAKTLRDHFSKEPKKPQDTGCHHRCGMSFFAQKQSTGYDDLDELTQSPKDLKFTFEILKIETDLDYEKEGWIMTDEEKSNSIAGLRDKGNTLYKSGDIGGAAAVYSEALTRLDALSIKEKPGDEGFLELERKKLPFLLNLAQCKLIQKEYYPAIELCGMAINIDPKNVKAHFRRGKAHMGAWNLKEARDDFRKAEEMDSNMSATIKQLLAQTSQLEKEKNEEDRRKLGGLFTKT